MPRSQIVSLASVSQTSASGISSGRNPGRIDRASGQVEPLALAFGQIGQAEQLQEGEIIAVEVEQDSGRRAVHEKQAALSAAAIKEKAADPMAGQAGDLRFLVGDGKTGQLDEAFTA